MLLVLVFSIVVGIVWEESYVVVGLIVFVIFIKGWSEFKKYFVKMNMCCIVQIIYEKILIELKNFVRGGLEDMSYFLVKM